MTNRKMWVVLPVIVLLILAIFSLTLIPAVNQTPKNIPVAVVNLDEGAEIPEQGKLNVGNTIVESMQKMAASAEEPPVQLVELSSVEEMMKGFDDQNYYAGLVIPETFSMNQGSLRSPNPTSPQLDVYTNEGMNRMATMVAQSMLDQVVTNLNENVRKQVITGFEQQGMTLSPSQAEQLATPITKQDIQVNEVGENSANGNAPVSLFQPLWMACMAGAALTFFFLQKRSRKQDLKARGIQLVLGLVLALTAGFGLTWLADVMVGLTLPNFVDTALFLSLVYFSFFVMISAVLSWIGLKGIGIFALLLFFGAPLLTIPTEFMTSFYHDWIYPWMPMRFMTEGLRDLFYFDKALGWNEPTSALVWIAVGSLVVLFSSRFKRSSVEMKEGASVQKQELV
ncbi:YhgE/Pip domain-containing protein [Alkalihalobacillus sp. CinArs1]|uniref:YhgE/Pip domain-containing protein n=1 Tax=Alkalihalobacillus sp. CinArs1 TaxID=2995314 RepID=UPI0022DCFB73|nr:ABC transporter permease [Alkalihalobacillus sp. CinArs1]